MDHRIWEKAMDTCAPPDGMFPDADLFAAYADNSNHFLDFGICEGTMVFFDANQQFSDGMPSCFINEATGEIAILRHRKQGMKHAGKLVAVMNRI